MELAVSIGLHAGDARAPRIAPAGDRNEHPSILGNSTCQPVGY